MGIVLQKAFIIIGVCLIFLGLVSSGYILGLGPFFIWEVENYRFPAPLFSDFIIIPYDTFQANLSNLETGTEVIINFEVTNYTKLEEDIIDITGNSGKIIDFFIIDEANFVKWQNKEETIKHLYVYRTNLVNTNLTIPYEGNWYFVLDNTFTNTETKELQVDVEVIIDLPFHGSITDLLPAFIFAVIIIIFGILLVAYGLLKKTSTIITEGF